MHITVEFSTWKDLFIIIELTVVNVSLFVFFLFLYNGKHDFTSHCVVTFIIHYNVNSHYIPAFCYSLLNIYQLEQSQYYMTQC